MNKIDDDIVLCSFIDQKRKSRRRKSLPLLSPVTASGVRLLTGWRKKQEIDNNYKSNNENGDNEIFHENENEDVNNNDNENENDNDKENTRKNIRNTLRNSFNFKATSNLIEMKKMISNTSPLWQDFRVCCFCHSNDNENENEKENENENGNGSGSGSKDENKKEIDTSRLQIITKSFAEIKKEKSDNEGKIYHLEETEMKTEEEKILNNDDKSNNCNDNKILNEEMIEKLNIKNYYKVEEKEDKKEENRKIEKSRKEMKSSQLPPDSIILGRLLPLPDGSHAHVNCLRWSSEVVERGGKLTNALQAKAR